MPWPRSYPIMHRANSRCEKPVSEPEVSRLAEVDQLRATVRDLGQNFRQRSLHAANRCDILVGHSTSVYTEWSQ